MHESSLILLSIVKFMEFVFLILLTMTMIPGIMVLSY